MLSKMVKKVRRFLENKVAIGMQTPENVIITIGLLVVYHYDLVPR